MDLRDNRNNEWRQYIFNHVRAKKRHVQNLYADRIEQLNEYLTQPS